MKAKLIGLGLLLLILQSAEARIVTLVATNSEPKELQILLGEGAELTGWSAYTASLNASEMPYALSAEKDGVQVNLYLPPARIISTGASAIAAVPAKHVIAGPATIRLSNGYLNAPVYCTFSIAPEVFPPDKSLILPAGTNQVTITLECSTNLVNWVTATNGIYGSPTAAKFFRI